jgi:hypothetical protein
VTSRDGSETVLEGRVDRTVGDGESLDALYRYWRFDPDDPVLPGEYDAETSVTDELADGETASATEGFVLGAADVGNPYVAGFRMDVGANLDVGTEAVGFSDRTVQFEYRSEHGIDTRASGEEVGHVVGRYTAYVASGLETEERVATVGAADGTYRYWFSSETARAWANGDLTTEDVVGGIYETIEER